MSRSADNSAAPQKDSRKRRDFHDRFNLHASTAIRNNMPEDKDAPVVGLTFWMKDRVATKRVWLNKSFAGFTEDQFNRVVAILNEGLEKPVEVPFKRPEREQKTEEEEKPAEKKQEKKPAEKKRGKK